MGGSLEQAPRSAGLSSPRRAAIDAPPEAGSQPPGRSLLRSAPGVVLFAIVIADAMRAADTDLWGHIHFGNIVLTRHQFFFHAPSSYACPPGPRDWIMVDWLGEVLMALVYNVAGVVGLKLAKFACVAAVMVLLSLGMAETGAALIVQGLTLLAAAFAIIAHMQFRTFLADDVCLAALMAMFARESYGRSARLWLAVPMLALWTNLHGGFFVGLVAMGLYTAVRATQDLAEGRGLSRAIELAALTSAATLATLLNPYGMKDWIVIAGVLRNPFTLRHISEFRSLLAVVVDFHRNHRPLFTFISALAIMAGLLVTFALTPRADDLALFAVAALMTVSALYAVRNTALAVIACCLLHSALPPHRTDRRSPAPRCANRRSDSSSVDSAGVPGLAWHRGPRPGDPHRTAVEPAAGFPRKAGGSAHLHAPVPSSRQHVLRVRLGRLPDLARFAPLENFHREPLRSLLSGNRAE